MSEQFYTIQEIAERWRVDPEKVTRIIQNEPGVLDLGTHIGSVVIYRARAAP